MTEEEDDFDFYAAEEAFSSMRQEYEALEDIENYMPGKDRTLGKAYSGFEVMLTESVVENHSRSWGSTGKSKYCVRLWGQMEYGEEPEIYLPIPEETANDLFEIAREHFVNSALDRKKELDGVLGPMLEFFRKLKKSA